MYYDLFAFVGSLEQINPRHYRLLVGTVPHPTELSSNSSQVSLRDAGFGPLTLVIAENIQVHSHSIWQQSLGMTQCHIKIGTWRRGSSHGRWIF